MAIQLSLWDNIPVGFTMAVLPCHTPQESINFCQLIKAAQRQALERQADVLVYWHNQSLDGGPLFFISYISDTELKPKHSILAFVAVFYGPGRFKKKRTISVRPGK